MPSHFSRKISIGNYMDRKRGRDYEENMALKRNSQKMNAVFLTGALKTSLLSLKNIFPSLSNFSKREVSLSSVGNRKRRWMVTATYTHFSLCLKKANKVKDKLQDNWGRDKLTSLTRT